MPRKQAFQLCARRRLLWAGAAWAAVQLALAAGIEAWLPEVRDPAYAVRERRLLALRDAAPGEPLWVMLGSSRTQLGLQAGRIGQGDASTPVAFNFGMPGCGPMMQLVCLERLLDRGVRPDRLLVEVMPPMLSWRGGEPIEERMLDGSRLRCDELARLLPFYRQPRRALAGWLTAILLPSQRRGAALRRCIGWHDGRDGADADAPDHLMDEHGWQHVPCTADEARRRELISLAISQYDSALDDFRVAPQAAEALTKLLRRCRRESIPVTLVLMPEGRPFRALYSPRAESSLQRFLARLCREHEAALIDARRWIADEHFADGHHLLPEGALAFTDRFQRAAVSEGDGVYQVRRRPSNAPLGPFMR